MFRPPFQRWRTTRSGAGTGRAALYSPFLLLAFLCGYLAKEKRLKAFGINTPKTLFLLKQGAPLSCLTYVSHLLRKIESEKALQKENAVFCAPAAQASAFEKAEQNNRLVPANIVRDKFQFVYLFLEIKLLFQRLIFAEKPLPRIM